MLTDTTFKSDVGRLLRSPFGPREIGTATVLASRESVATTNLPESLTSNDV